jgi:apolipoprotein N-acyltransferase
MGRDRRVGCAAALVSAAALWLASPSHGLGLLAWVAVVPVAYVVLAGTGGPRWVVPLAYVLWLYLSLIPDLPPGIAAGQWGDPVLPLVADSPAVPVALVVLPLLAAVLVAIGFGRPWLAGRLGPRGRAAAALAVAPIAWTALEFVEIRALPGGWWATLAVSQDGLATAGLAAIGGPFLITLAIVAVNYALAFALVRRTPAAAGAAAVIVSVVAVAVIAAPVREGDGRSLVVAAVQPGYDTAERVPATRAFARNDYEQAAQDIIDDLAPLTRRAADQGARLIAWPEAAIWIDPRDDDPARRSLTGLARDTGAAIVVPMFLPERATSAVLVARPDGSLSAPVFKQRPMWYLGEGGRGAGPLRSIAAAGTRLGTLPGVDNEKPHLARRLVGDGARVLVSVTHDWAELAVYQRTFASLDAVATGAPVVRADWRYASSIQTPDGAVAADAGDARARTVLVAEVALGPPTPYVAIGDVVGGAALLAALAIGVLAAVAARRPADKS